MSRVYSKLQRGPSQLKSNINNNENDEREQKGKSFPAVDLSYSIENSKSFTTQPTRQFKISDVDKNEELGSDTATRVGYINGIEPPPIQRNESLSANSSKISLPSKPENSSKIDTGKQPNQSKNPCLTKLFQEHNYIETNLARHKSLIDEGQKKVYDTWFMGFTKPESLEYSELQILKFDELEKYNKLIINCPVDENDLQYQKYLKVVYVIKQKIKQYDAIQAERDRIDEQTMKDVDILYQAGIMYDNDKLLRTLQFSFPRREKTREIFLKKYGEKLDSFVKRNISLFDNKGFYWSMAQAYLEAGHLRPADKFYIAVKGPGTDEGNMFFAMKEAHSYGIKNLDVDLINEYPDFENGKSGLPHTGYGNDIWKSAEWIDSETSWGTDERIKAKALLSFGRIRPVDEVRMALSGDTSKNDLKKALREANAENLIQVREENSERCLTPNAENKLVKQKLFDDYKFSYGRDLMADIEAIHTKIKINYVVPSTTYKEVDEKGLSTVNKIINGEETKLDQFFDEKLNSKEELIAFSQASTAEKKIILDSMGQILSSDSAKKRYNKFVGIWEMEATQNPVYYIIKEKNLFDINSFESYSKYNIQGHDSSLFLKYLSSQKPIGSIEITLYDYLNTYLLKNSKLLWTYHYIGMNSTQQAKKELFQHIVNSKDKNWQTNYIMNVLNEQERKYYAYYWKDLMIGSIKDAQSKDNFSHIIGLLNNDPTVRIKAERSLLSKASSGLGAAITNIGSTSKLSASNEQRELEVDLEMAKWNDGVIDENEQKTIEQGILDARETRGNFEEIRDTVEGVATMVAQTLVTVAAGVLIPGAGSILAQAIIGGISSTATNWVMKGDRYTFENGFKDLVMGATGGAMGVFGNKAVSSLASGEGSFAILLSKSKLMQETLENSIGSSHEIVIDAVEGKSPEEIFKNHLKSIGTGIAIGRLTNIIEKGIATKKKTSKDVSDPVLESGDTGSEDTHRLGEGNPDAHDPQSDTTVAKPTSDVSLSSSYKDKNPHDWTEDDFISFLKEVGDWDTAIDQLTLVGGKDLAFKLHKIRGKLQYDLIHENAAPLSDASNDIKSDADLSVDEIDTTGTNAVRLEGGANLLRLEAALLKKYGANYKKMFKLEFFTNATRLGKYSDLQSQVSAERYESIVSEVTAHQDTFQYAKMLRDAQSSSDQLARIEALISSRPDIDKIRDLAKLTPTEMMAKRDKLLLEVDQLLVRYANPKLKPKDKERLAIQISKKQAETNFYSNDAYISFGAMTKKPTSGIEVKGALISQLQMVQHQISAYGSTGKASKGYEVYKYISRYIAMMEAAGIPLSPRMKLFRELSYEIYPAQNGSRDFYDTIGTSRTDDQRKAVMDSFLDEAYSNLDTYKFDGFDEARLKQVADFLKSDIPLAERSDALKHTKYDQNQPTSDETPKPIEISQNVSLQNLSESSKINVKQHDEYGVLPPNSSILIANQNAVVYTLNGKDYRIRFRASSALTLKEANPGRNMTTDSLAGLTSDGIPYVHEGRHRAIGAAKADVVSSDNGGVVDAPGWLDFEFSVEVAPSGGFKVIDLEIDYTQIDVNKAEADKIYYERFNKP